MYAGWLREEFDFPVCLHVYCEYGHKLRCGDGSHAYGVVITDDSRRRYPKIRLACGGFDRDDPVSEIIVDELDGIMLTLTHELIHYFQYINGFDMDRSRSIEMQATYWANRILRHFDSLYDED